MSTLAPPSSQVRAACQDADPDLFFPDSSTPVSRIAEAKRICAGCPIKQACLEDAIRRGEPDAICGGLTAQERRKMVNLDGQAGRVRRPGKASARQLAVKHGAHLLVSLVEWRMSPQQVAESLGSTPMAVYLAYLMLVPPKPGQHRSKKPSILEEIVHGSKDRLLALQRRGLSHSEIGAVLEVPQSMVSASLAVLRQREEGIRRLSKNGVDGLARLQEQELRVLRECGAGLSVNDVIAIEGKTILRMHHSRMALRDIAAQLGLCRETVRLAYRQMTSSQQVMRTLTKSEMEEAA